MGTTQFENSEFGETFAEKNVHFESTEGQAASKQEGAENESGSEPEIYLLVSHHGRKRGPPGGRKIGKIGLFGPFGPHGPKGFGFPPLGRPHRIGRHPHEMSDVRRGPPHARGFKRGPHFMHHPERDEGFTNGSESERGHSPHRGMHRFGPGPHERRGPTLEAGSEFHREARHRGDPIRRPHGFGPREHGHGPRDSSRGRFETEERVHSHHHHHPHPHPHPHPHHPHHPHHHHHHHHPHHHHLTPREHGHGPRGIPRGRFESDERIRHLPREHGHGFHPREHGLGPRGRREAEENVKQFHRRRPGSHENSPHRDPRSHKHGHGPHERFETEGNVKEPHGKHGRRGGHPSLGNEHGPHGGSPSRGHGHGFRGRFDIESGYSSDHSEHRGPHRHGFGPHGRRKHEHGRHRSDGSDAEYETGRRHRFECGMHGSESEHESDCSSKSFDRHLGGHRFEHGRHGLKSHYMSEIFRNRRGGFDPRGRRRFGRGGPRLHRHVPRNFLPRGHRFHHRHPSKPLTPEELAEKVALLNSMGFASEDNSHYEELLKRFNGRIGRVVEILLREKERDDENKGNDGENEEKDGENEEEEDGEDKETPLEDFDILEEKAGEQS